MNKREKPDDHKINKHLGASGYYHGIIELMAITLAYWDHTGDEAFRDEVLLPLAKECTAFYELHWPKKNGKLHFHPISVLETCQLKSTNPLPDIAGLHDILPRLVAICPDAAQKQRWLNMMKILPPIPMGEKNGRKYLKYADAGPYRRIYYENPALYAIFPYQHYGIGKPGMEIALETWKNRKVKKTGGWRQDAIQAAMLGLAGEAREYVASNFTRTEKGFRFPAMWARHYDWTPDQDNGSVAMIALQKMLLYTDGDEIHLLPAWPKDWNVRFRLRAPRNTVITGSVRNGTLQKLEVTPGARRKDVIIAKPFLPGLP